MSRRQSRVSADLRQTDTLLEFEIFKKKFLLANKHITKLNSTLSVRIEELNAQISTLYVENLRLRASEIALTAQLKREREKSRKVLADAEAATYNLMNQFGVIRKTFNIPSSTTPDASPPEKPLQSRARRPVSDPNVSPPLRIARPPDVPGIMEEDETEFPSSGPRQSMFRNEYSITNSLTPAKRKKPRPSSSSSSLPSTQAISLPPPFDVRISELDEEMSRAGKRKPTRRQSGLLTTSMSITTMTPKGISTEIIPTRPASPAFGSPIRLETALDEEEEAMVQLNGTIQDDESEEPLVVGLEGRGKKRKSKEKDMEKDDDYDDRQAVQTDYIRSERENTRVRPFSDTAGIASGKKPKLKDVTNAPPPRPSLRVAIDRERTSDSDHAGSATSTSSYASARAFLSTPGPGSSYLPSPRPSSPVPVLPSEAEEQALGGRERRVRKSVNYAEPKLNTKLRKPDPPPTEQKQRSRADDSAAGQSTVSNEPQVITPSSSSSSSDHASATSMKRKKSRGYVTEDEDSDGVQADAEVGQGISTAWANVNSRRRSYANSTSRRAETDDARRHSMAV